MESKEHWETIYSAKRADSVSWFAPHLELPLDLVRQAAPDKNAQIAFGACLEPDDDTNREWLTQ